MDALLEEARRQSRVFRVNAVTMQHVDGLAELAHDVVKRAAAEFHAPLSSVTLIFAEHALVVAAIGADPGQYELDSTYCKHVYERRDWVGVTNSLDDPLVCHNLATTLMGVRSYLGVPLITDRGHIIGALCVADFGPREWTDEQVARLESIAAELMEAERQLRQ